MGVADRLIAVSAVAGLSGAGVLADAFLKRSTMTPSPFTSGWFMTGLIVYASTSFGWVYAMARMKLASIGAIYCVFTVLLLTIVSTAVFGESLNPWEVTGIGLAVASLVLLARFG